MGKIGKILCMLGLCFLGLLLETVVGTLLWNAIVVPIFGAAAISFWQFLGLIILLYILIPKLSIKED